MKRIRLGLMMLFLSFLAFTGLWRLKTKNALRSAVLRKRGVLQKKYIYQKIGVKEVGRNENEMEIHGWSYNSALL